MNRSPRQWETSTAEIQVIPRFGSDFDGSDKYSRNDEKLSETDQYTNNRNSTSYRDSNMQIMNKTLQDDVDDISSSVLSKDIPSSGMLVVGTVYACSYLPIGKGSEDINCQSFFRVILSEGSSKSSLMNARSVAYTSNPTYYDEIVQWPESSDFRFLLPSTQSNQSEIILAIYKTKIQGGNECIGQISLSIASLSEAEVITVKGSDSQLTEARRVMGAFALHVSSKSTTNMTTSEINQPEINLKLEVFWRKEIKVTPNPEVISLPKSTAKANSVGGSSIASSSRPSSAGSRVKSQQSLRPSAYGQGVTTVKPTIRKIVSAGLRKKREDDMRIERENKILLSRLQSFSNSKARQIHEQPFASNPKSNEAKSEKQEAKDQLSLRGKSDKELLDLLNTLKQQTFDKQKENHQLKGKINKYKTQSSKLQMTNDRIKKCVESFSKYSQAENTKIDVMNSRDVDDIADLKADSALSNVLKKAAERSDRSWIFSEYNLSEAAIVDQELIAIIDEHFRLQNMRRDFIIRLQTLKNKLFQNKVTSQRVQQAKNIVSKRLSQWFPSYANTIQEFHPIRVSSNPRNRLEEKNQRIDIESQINERKVFKSLMKLKNEYDGERMLHLNNLQSAEYRMKDREYKAIHSKLENVKLKYVEELEELMSERDKWRDKLKSLQDSQRVLSLRENLGSLKQIHSRLRREQKIADIMNNL